jgi:hypothetical protein
MFGFYQRNLDSEFLPLSESSMLLLQLVHSGATPNISETSIRGLVYIVQQTLISSSYQLSSLAHALSLAISISIITNVSRLVCVSRKASIGIMFLIRVVKEKDKNNRQQVFAGGHPPNY